MAQFLVKRNDDPTSVNFGRQENVGLLSKKKDTRKSGIGSAAKAEGFRQGVKLVEQGIEGFSDAQGLKPQSKILDFNAKQVELAGKQQGLEVLESLNDLQASNIVAAFASGIRLQGSITEGQQEAARKAGFANAISKFNADIEAGSFRREARRLRAEAKYNKQIAPLKLIAGAVIMYYTAGQG